MQTSVADPSANLHGAAELTINLGALKRNYCLMAARAGEAECAAVVKADGYGLGIKPVFRALREAGCTTFFVATLNEAITLRTLCKGSAVYYLNGLMHNETDICRTHSIRPTLNDPGQIERWATYCCAVGEALPAAIHIDTGMSRLGLTPHEAKVLALAPQRIKDFDFALLMSHLACADTPDHPLNARQRDQFEDTAASLPKARKSLAASSGVFLGPEWHFDMVRAGVSLYGVSPQENQTNPMEQVIKLKGTILQTRDVDTPQTGGYGAAHRFKRPTKVATVATGYADGYPCSLGGKGVAYIGNRAVPLIGRVSMDLITLDIGNAHDAKPGDMVDLIGPHNDLDSVAALAGTTSYEFLTRLGKRHCRRYSETAA